MQSSIKSQSSEIQFGRWQNLPLELKQQILSHVLPAIDDKDALRELMTDSCFKKPGRHFVHNFERYLLINKAFTKAMQSPLEQYVRDMQVYCDVVLEKEIQARRYHDIDFWELSSQAERVAYKVMEKESPGYARMSVFTYDKRRYILRLLQRIRGREPASWHSLPFQIRIQIMEFVLPNVCVPLGHSEDNAHSILIKWRVPDGRVVSRIESVLLNTHLTVAHRLAPRGVTSERIHMHYRELHKQLHRLNLVSKQFSIAAHYAITFELAEHKLDLATAITSEKPGQAELLARYENGRERWPDAEKELEDDVTSDWIRAVRRLDSYVESVYELASSCTRDGFDGDEVVDWSYQKRWLLDRRTSHRR